MLSIDADGVIYLQKEPQELATLPEKLAAVREARGQAGGQPGGQPGSQAGGKIYLRADGGLSYGFVQQVLAMVRNANFASISMVHDQPRQVE